MNHDVARKVFQAVEASELGPGPEAELAKKSQSVSESTFGK